MISDPPPNPPTHAVQDPPPPIPLRSFSYAPPSPALGLQPDSFVLSLLPKRSKKGFPLLVGTYFSGSFVSIFSNGFEVPPIERFFAYNVTSCRTPLALPLQSCCLLPTFCSKHRVSPPPDFVPLHSIFSAFHRCLNDVLFLKSPPPRHLVPMRNNDQPHLPLPRFSDFLIYECKLEDTPKVLP